MLLPAEGNLEKLHGGSRILNFKNVVGLDTGKWLEKEHSRRKQHEHFIVHRVDPVEQRALSWCFCPNAWGNYLSGSSN